MNAAPSFKILPEPDELEQMQRDLRFYPSQVTDPKVLRREQVEQFNRDGYIRGLRVFDAAGTEQNRKYFDALLAKVLAAGGDSYSISTAHLKYGYVYDLITNPHIVDCVADLLGPNVIGWGSHFFCKMPKDGKAVAWHQDASYWPLTPSKTVTVWLAIDDADRENACMKFVAGSQNVGHLTYRPSSEADHNVLNQSIDNAEQYGTIVYDVLQAGEFSMLWLSTL